MNVSICFCHDYESQHQRVDEYRDMVHFQINQDYVGANLLLDELWRHVVKQ